MEPNDTLGRCPECMGYDGVHGVACSHHPDAPLPKHLQPRIRDRDMELAMQPLPEGWDDAMRSRLKDDAAPRIVSIGNPMPPNDFHQHVMAGGRNAGRGAVVPYPTFEEPRDPGVMDPRNPTATPFHMPVAVDPDQPEGVASIRDADGREVATIAVPTVQASEATTTLDLFGDSLGDLRYRDQTSPTDAARAKARKRRKRRR